ncbi:putative tyrosine-protein phosphatase [Gordonia polyisoprenivorans VH2]|uniref:Putative tyrosine-protein phosphatase n=1 Tax=Gordonia polyisoprenivorans (strain DSM 44266 / VH2) TaxID=1112204 RepID=H6MYY4_GORPV|nr:putative tyrosine-protein phosphatase [Gordonia polyisoprenivorans VH2]QUD85354.1 tyrosine-protein phosphatase [Gordonia polyisoprenivorans]
MVTVIGERYRWHVRAVAVACTAFGIFAPAATIAAPVGAAPPAVSTTPTPQPQAVDLGGVTNARTLHDYRTADGAGITDKVIRSANLSTIDDRGITELRRRGVRTIIDLRTAFETRLQPDKSVPGTAVESFDVLRTAPTTDLIDIGSAYRQFVVNPVARQAFRDSLLATQRTVADGGAVLFHCTAGKDRTGWLAAVLLTILGVDRSVVDADYLASNRFRHASATDPLNGVNLGLLDTAFGAVRTTYGSFDNYVHHGLGLSDADVDALRHTLLIPAL